MKRAFKFISIIMMICLVFTSAAFAAQGDDPDGDTQETAAPLIIAIPDADEGQGISEEDTEDVLTQVVTGERHMDEPVWTGTETAPVDSYALNQRWMSVDDNLGVDGGLVTLDDIPWSNGAYSLQNADNEDGTEKMPQLASPKEIPLVVLVVGFSNIDYSASYNWKSTVFTASDSLAKYYTDQSFGKFTFVPAKEASAYGTGGNTNSYDQKNDGIVHVKLNMPHEDWSLSLSTLGYINSLISEGKAIKAAILASDQYVDYSSFDADKDGLIENNEMALAVVMAGYEAAYDTTKPLGDQYYIWSHAWALSGVNYYDSSFTLPTPDNVKVNSFITIAENLTTNTQAHIGVLAHELGHYIGLPDLYDTVGESSSPWYNYEVGAVSVMANGVWGWNGSKYVPSSFDAWSRCILGWVRPTVVQNGQYTVQSTQGNYNVLMVQTTNKKEYYLVENRQYSGWDVSLSNSYSNYAPSGGLIFWHIDDAIYENSVENGDALNGGYHRPGVMPLYPETTNGSTSGTYTFVGILPSGWTSRPFYNSSILSTVTNYGDHMGLPMYDGSNSPGARKFFGITVKILSGSGSSMTVQFGNTVKPAFVDRIAGSNRFKTAFEALDYYRNTRGNGIFGNIVIASGKDYPDALSGSYFAIRNNAPILLVNDSTVDEVASYVKTNMQASGTVYILGGTGAVPARMETALYNVGISSSNIKRLQGANRYETNIAILKYAGVRGRDLLICSGTGYADALSASSVEKPILLTNGSSLTASQKSFLSSYGSDFANIYCIGGDGVISNQLAWEIYKYVDPSFDPYNDNPAGARIWRVAGKDRFKTSVEVAKVFYGSTRRIFLAYAMNFPDGLSGGPVANYVGAPMLLVTNKYRDDAKNFVSTYGAYECTIMGGKTLISDDTAYYILGK